VKCAWESLPCGEEARGRSATWADGPVPSPNEAAVRGGGSGGAVLRAGEKPG